MEKLGSSVGDRFLAKAVKNQNKEGKKFKAILVNKAKNYIPDLAVNFMAEGFCLNYIHTTSIPYILDEAQV